MRRITIFIVALVMAGFTAHGAWAQDEQTAPLPYPGKDNYESYAKFIRDVQAFYAKNQGTNASFAWEPFRGLVEAGRDEGVYQLAKAMRDAIPDGSYRVSPGAFVNPVNLAYEAGRFDLVKRLIGLDKALAGMCDEGDEGTGLTPLATAVAHDDIKWAQAFLDAGASLGTGNVESVKGGETYPVNLFTISKSKAMDDFLAGKDLSTVFVLASPVDGSCNDDNVRLRSGPSAQGAVLAKLMKGDKFSVLATTYKRDTIDDYPGHWVKISHKGQIGWIFQEFVECDYFDMN
jgi:hypothetical protein